MISLRAIDYGHDFEREFRRLTQGGPAGEIGLFRKMMEALTAAGVQGAGVNTAEFHGSNHQVTFVGPGGYSRVNARCELADVMVVAFSPHSKQARLSFIQAKSERKFGIHTGIVGQCLKANLEQWDLLSRRPHITGVGRFNPPNDLLSGAALPSVGSFAFFVNDGNGGYEIYYASAQAIPMGGRYTQRNGSLRAQPQLWVRTPHGCECRSLLGAHDFGVGLASLSIGTPVGPSHQGQWARDVNPFIARQIRSAARSLGNDITDQQRELAIAAGELLDPDNRFADVDYGAPAFGARSLLLVRTGSPESVSR